MVVQLNINCSEDRRYGNLLSSIAYSTSDILKQICYNKKQDKWRKAIFLHYSLEKKHRVLKTDAVTLAWSLLKQMNVKNNESENL